MMAKRSNPGGGGELEGIKKVKQDIVEKFEVSTQYCSFRHCQSGSKLCPEEEHVEIQAAIPKQGFAGFIVTCIVSWAHDGAARFHKSCWEEVLKASRARNVKKAKYKMSSEEKSMVKDAAKTVEYHDSVENIEKKAKRIAELIQQAQHCIAFTGAGISTAAGIGDYRGKSGKWTEQDRERVVESLQDQIACSTSNPTSLRRMSSESSVMDDGISYESLRPTYTHEALAKLINMGLLQHIISQNGDGLHGLSGVQEDKLSELHGNVFIKFCDKCGHRYHRSTYVLDDDASFYYEQLQDNEPVTVKKPKHAKQCETCGLNHRTGRKCDQPNCKGFLKDTIINFGDNLEDKIFCKAEEHAANNDLCLCLGTTLRVTPACELVESGQKPLRLVICNRQKTGLDDVCYAIHDGSQLGVRVFGDCDLLMQKIMKELLPLRDLNIWEKDKIERLKQYDACRIP